MEPAVPHGVRSFTLRLSRTLLHFGPNTLRAGVRILSKFKRIYVVTGKGSAKRSGALDDLTSVFKEMGPEYRIFDDVRPNPSDSLIEEVARGAWSFGAEALVAVGGGSAIDAAKLAGVLVECGGKVEDYVSGSRDFCGSLPVIAVNLTHGTGSEVDRYAVATLESIRVKRGLASEVMYPVVSIDDPIYTLSLPSDQAAYTSFDVLYHAIEAACGKDSSPFVISVAEEAVRLVVKWLPIALREPRNLEARYWLLYASALAGIAIDNSRAHAIHMLENVLSGLNTSLPHGAGLALIGPTAVKYLYRASPAELYPLLRHLDPQLEPHERYAEKAAIALKRFHLSHGLRQTLVDYGFSEADADDIVRALRKYLSYGLVNSPVEFTDDMFKEMIRDALSYVV